MDIEERMRRKKTTIRTLLVVLTIVVSIVLFGKIYPDSLQYIWFTQYFGGANIELIFDAGVLEEMVVRAPFLYRPALPFLASIFGGFINPVFIMSLLNMVFLVVMTDMMFYLTTRLSNKISWALLSTLLTVVSYPLIYYGAVPLADAFSMLLFVGIISCAENNYGDECAALTIFIGVFVKEIILILGLYYVIRTHWKSFWVLIPGGVAALCLRLALGMKNTLIFNLSILTRPIQVIGMFGLTFAIPVLIILYYWKKGNFGTCRGKRVLLAGLIATLPLVGLGLFFAYFDGRFIWPLLIIVSLYLSSMR